MTVVSVNCAICDSREVKSENRRDFSSSLVNIDCYLSSTLIDGNDNNEQPIFANLPTQETDKSYVALEAQKRTICDCFDFSSAEWDSIFQLGTSQESQSQCEFRMCINCKEMTIRLVNFLEQMRQLQMEISSMKAKLNSKVLSSYTNQCLSKSTDNDTDSESLLPFSSYTVSNSPTFNFRRFIYKRYTPKIVIKDSVSQRGRRMKIHESNTRNSIDSHSIENEDSRSQSLSSSESILSACSIGGSGKKDQRHVKASSDSDSSFSSDENKQDDPDFTGDEGVVEEAEQKKRRNRTENSFHGKFSSRIKNDRSGSKKKTPRNRAREKSSKERVRKRRLKSPASRQNPFEISPGLFQFRQWKFQANEDATEFNCLTCEHTSASRREMLDHINTLHNTERFRCSQCKKSWRSQKKFEIHTCTPKGNRKVKTRELPDGKVTFLGEWEYEKVDDIVGYKCGICGALKKSKMIMNRHIQERHADPNRYVCELCGRGFGNKRVFHSHLETHSSNDPTSLWVCDECGQTFSTQARLYFHKQSHVSWACGHCNKSFKYKNGLVRHQRVVGHQEILVRSTSSAARIEASELDDQHSGNSGPIPCHKCDKIYQTKETHSAHLLRCRGKPRYPCDECGKMLANIFVFRSHKRRHAEKRAKSQHHVEPSEPNMKGEDEEPSSKLVGEENHNDNVDCLAASSYQANDFD